MVFNLCALACFLVIQGSAVAGEGLSGILPTVNVSINISPSPAPQPNGTNVQPPLVMPPFTSSPPPQMTKGPISFPLPTAPSIPPSFLPIPPPTSTHDSVPAVPPMPPPAEPIASPPTNPDVNSSAPASTPPTLNQTKPPISNPPLTPIAPVSSVPATAPRNPDSPGPAHSVLPNGPPSLPPERDGSIPPEMSTNVSPPVTPPLPEEPVSSPPEKDVSIPPEMSRNGSPPVKSPLPEEPRSSPPEQNVSPMLTPPPSISSETAPAPLPASANKSANSYAPVSHSPSKGPPANKSLGHSYKAPAPHPVASSPPVFDSPKKHHHRAPDYIISPAPPLHIIPPSSSKPAHPYHKKSDPKSNLSHYAPPPTSTGSSKFPPPNISPSHAEEIHHSPTSAPSPPSSPSPSWPTKISPKLSPPVSPPKHPKTRPPPPWQTLPPPPPQKDCAPLTCTDPLTYGPPEYPCVCVLPIQVGLSLTVALYTFFPLVSELASEIAAGVFMKQSQVRIMGANAAENNPEKTIVLIDLVPLGEKFDDTTAFLTFQRLWQKQLLIKPSIFGDYDVLYVRYPGLPPSPPLPPSTIGIVSSEPYPGHTNEPGPLKPIGVDTRGNQHRDGPSGSIMATIVLSAFVAAILLCVVAWIFLFKHRDCGHQPDPAPASTIRSLAKSSGMAISTVGSGPTSPAFSLGSSIVAYNGSAKTFTSSDLEKATDNFNETQVLGEGGFGIVYSGVLEDGTKIAVKILKRYDQQGSREFLAEVEMLTRLHHRNLVKLIGICTEARTRCLVYELIPNGSVESHLHGIDKDSAPLDWSARLKIALGSARALAYLHEDSSPRVIHRDFKASNILLEDDFTPKVSDFGLARTALDEDNKHISTRVMGTFGYVAPEYAMTGHLLVKSDVYSYGVVLLELLTGRKPVDMSQPPGQENLVSWARPLLTTQEGLESVIDPILGTAFPFDSIAKVAAIASVCVQPEVSHRPFMGEVVQALKLVSNEMRELRTENSVREDLSVDMESKSSTNSDHLMNESPVSNYDYRIDCERDVSMSELLSSSVQFDRQDSDSYRRHSSSGPIRTGRTKQLWKTIGRLSGGTVSEHGVMFRLWPGSH